ncbi:hypothetical protein SAMN05216345_111132 [Cupriavidus sp. YR651]|uniref:hypothetical protein n=1 Tax=Cupriavidus sp. YR651 TaxID=1855315 RepID=UPI00087F11D4|nr:hypothetical protein [Cupriavidus sp. YR651]SDD58178.1 hypothetical protein SAMN05216345_111132 [Cupriavidus sp. YR651]
MPVIHTRETAYAVFALVVILIVALFFIVTTTKLALLYVQLSALLPIALAIASVWIIFKFDQLTGQPA